MATYTTSCYNDAAVAFPTSGLHLVRVKHTLTAALAQGTSDVLKLCKLPKGAVIVPQLCEVFSAADPDSGNNATLAMKVTDGTTTKTIISAANYQAANVRLTGATTAADIPTLGFFKTGNDDFYALLEPGANDVDSGAVVYAIVAYTMDTGRYDSTT